MNIRVTAALTAALLMGICLALPSKASATSHHRHRVNYETGEVIGGRPAGCPYAFCGCGTALHIFGRIVPALNLAANWRRFPSAPCAAGNAAWRWGHVFAIQSCNGDGTAVAYDSNSGGHRTRIHTVSLRGYHIVNPHGNLELARNTKTPKMQVATVTNYDPALR